MLASITSFPIGKDQSLSKYVAGSLKIIRDSGLKYKMGPMSTTIEGTPYQVSAPEGLATNGRLHAHILAAIHSNGP